MFGKIYSDEMLLQRLLNKWDDDIATRHMIDFLEGGDNIHSIVLINLNSALNYSNNLLFLIYVLFYSNMVIFIYPLSRNLCTNKK